MSRLAGLGLAATACLFVADCNVSSCKPTPCPTLNVTLQAVPDSTVTWTYRDSGKTTTTTGFVPDPPSAYECSFKYDGVSMTFPGDANPGRLDLAPIRLSCSAGQYGHFDVAITGLGDARDWPAGTSTQLASAGKVDVLTLVGSTCLDDLALTLTVENATGGAAAYPQLVTADFVRTFRLDFDTSTVTPKDSDGGECNPVMGAKVSLHLTQTAADYVADPNWMCGCV